MNKLAPYAKAIAALLGGLTPAIVIAVLDSFGVTVAPTAAAAICTVIAGLATYLAPANKAAAVPDAPVDPAGGQHAAS